MEKNHAIKLRIDQWTDKEDELLANAVIKHIAQGDSQLKAFDYAGEKLNRTANACGFRFNKVLRNKYRKEIDKAKSKCLKTRRNVRTPQFIEKEVTIESVMKDITILIENSNLVTSEVYNENKILKAENIKLKERLAGFEKVFNQLKHLNIQD